MLRSRRKEFDLTSRSGGALKLHLRPDERGQARSGSESGSPWPPPSLAMATSDAGSNASNSPALHNAAISSSNSPSVRSVAHSSSSRGSTSAVPAPHHEATASFASSQESQESQNSSLSQIFSRVASQVVSSKWNIFSPPPPDTESQVIKYPELPPLDPESESMPGAFPITPMPPSADLPRPTLLLSPLLPVSPPRSEGRASDPSSSRGRGTPIMKFNVNSPSPIRRSISRASSPSLEARARRHNKHLIISSSASETGTETGSDDGFEKIESNPLASPGNHYPPRGHRTFIPYSISPVREPMHLEDRPSTSNVVKEELTIKEELDRTPMPLNRNIAPEHARVPSISSPKAVLSPDSQALAEMAALERQYEEEQREQEEELRLEEEMRREEETRRQQTQPYNEDDVPTRTASPVGDPSDRRRTSNRSFNPRGFSDDLIDRFPIVVAHAPSHQPLWDRLPIGTVFNVALVANEHELDLDKFEPYELEKLLGRNLTLEQVEQILGVGNTTRVRRGDESKVMEELDWEAEQIVKGTGDMLGWKEEKGTRYGGKIQFSATLKWDESSQSRTDPFNLIHEWKVGLEPLAFRGSSIFSRTFGSHRFLRVPLGSKIKREVSVWSGNPDSRQRAKNKLKEWMIRPIVILGRVYSPLLEKDGSAFYFLEGRDNVGEEFDKRKRDYGIEECTSVKDLLDWWIPFEYNGDQTISKLVTRLELGVSDTLPGVFIQPENVEIAEDIENKDGKIFTDGAGLITPSVSKALMDKYYGGPSMELHMAYQVRIQTAKGVVLVDPVMLDKRDFRGPHRIKLYRSMCKARRGNQGLRPGPVHGLHILDAAACMLCIVKPAPASSAQGARLSGQFITILSDCGVPDGIILQLEADALIRELREWTEVTVDGPKDGKRLDETTRLRIAKLIGRTQALALMIKRRELGGSARGYGLGSKKRLQVEEEDETEDEAPVSSTLKRYESFSSQITASGKIEKPVETWSHNEISGFPAFKAQALQDALYAGIEVWKSTYWSNIWKDLAKAAMLNIVSKFHLTVEKSASGFFQPDPTGLLKPGEIFFRPKEEMIDSTTGMKIDKVLGPVIVGRHPALLPTDMSKVTAVANPLLEPFKGIVFTSVHGDIGLAELCAGGDHDGDEATIIWDPEIVNPFRNAPPQLRLPPRSFDDRFEKQSDKVRDVHSRLRRLKEPEFSIQLSKALLPSVGEWDAFKIYNSLYNMAVYRDGLRNNVDSDQSALILAHSFNALMDAKKSGIRIKDEVLKKDKEYWSRFEEPYWKRKQLESDKKPQRLESSNPLPLKPYNDYNILDRLVDGGIQELDGAMKRLELTLQPPKRGEDAPLYFDGSGKDRALLEPWETAKADQAKRDDCAMIEALVKDCFAQFKKLNVDSQRKLCGARARTLRLRGICRNFMTNPPLDQLSSFRSEGDLQVVKASCAYALDMETSRRGGNERGFCWTMAMRELCAMKARDLSEGDTITLPHSVRDRLETHRYWASLQ